MVIASACAPNVESLEAEGDFDGLVAALGYAEDADVRRDAAEALGRLEEPRAVAPLVAALADPDADVRTSLVNALGVLGGESVLEPLTETLGDEVANVRTAAITAVASFGLPQSVEPILEAATEDADAEVRQHGSSALDRLLEMLGLEAASASLVDTLQHERSAVRVAAAHLLTNHGTESALVPLLVAVADEVPAVGRAAKAAFDELIASAEIRAGSPLIEALAHQLAHVRMLAAEAIGTYGGSSAVPALLEALHDTDSGVRMSAIEALGQLGDEKVVAPLLGLEGESEPNLSASAARALDVVVGRLGEDAAVATLHELATTDDRVSEGAERRLGEVLARMEPQAALTALFATGASDARLAGVLEVPAELLGAELTRREWWLENILAIRRAVQGVRDGTGVPEANAYQASGSFHPAVFVGAAWPDAVHQWRPAALRFNELVVVADDPTTETVEVCDYVNPNGPLDHKLTRLREVQRVRILTARDGALVAERWFSGTNPRACQESELFDIQLTDGGVEMPDSKTVTGDPVDLASDAASWARGFINPPE